MQLLSVPKIKSSAAVMLLPETTFLTDQMPKEGITLNTSPYIVGRHSDNLVHARHKNPLPHAHLELTDTKPYRLSRNHFSIQKMYEGVFIIRDLASALGTVVNNIVLGNDTGRFYTELNPGENIISIGDGDTRFRFRVIMA